MEILLNTSQSTLYTSSSQKVRVTTEPRALRNLFCPQCGGEMRKYPNNNPVGDFFCKPCSYDFELKAKKNSLGKKIVDGAYDTLIQRIISASSPNFIVLAYSPALKVTNCLVIPNYYFVPSIVEKRKPLSATARRAGRVGSTILLTHIPESGKIYYIQNEVVIPKQEVLKKRQRNSFLEDTKEVESKGWLIDILLCIDALGKKEFELSEVYAFEEELQKKYPNNNHIRDKIRQQLQILRDRNFLMFQGKGSYKLVF